MNKFKKYQLKKDMILKSFVIAATATLLIPSVKTFADEYWYSPELDRIKNIPKPEEALNSKINIKDGFNVPGSRQEFATWDGDNWSMYYNGNSTFKVNTQQNMAVMYNDTWIGQKGMMWYNRTVNLNYSFEVESYFLVQAKYLQSANGFYGASNGLAFVLQNDPAGRNAIGGRSGGMGVYPTAVNTENMIYNALTVEFDTSNNFSEVTNAAGHDKKLNKRTTTPHMAVGSTYVSSSYDTHKKATTKVINDFTHDALLTPSTPGITTGSGNLIGEIDNTLIHTEGDSWYNQWVKVTTRWEPVLNTGVEEGDSANITYGRLSYQLGPVTNQKTGEVYTYPLMTSEAINIDKVFNTKYPKSNWNRNVYWGYTGAGQANADGAMYYGNDYVRELLGRKSPAAIMVTKLPFEADIDVARQVKNVTTGEADYKEKTTAHVGDVVEYKVDIANKVMAQSDLPFTKFKLQEDLQTNNYVANSFKLTSSSHTGPVARINTSGGSNIFTVGLDSYDTSDSEIAKYTYDTGTSFSYTYQVTIGEDTQTFDNKINVASAYTSEMDYGDTSVVVYPKGEGIIKSLPNVKNPKVGEDVDVQLDVSVGEGVLKLKDIVDSIPSGFELKTSSTKLSLLDKDNGVVNTLDLNDSDIWSGLNLTINDTNVSNLSDFLLKGGTTNKRTVRVNYTIIPTEEVKGEIIVLPKSQASGSSINDGFNTVIDYDFAETIELSVKVKTDYTILFKHKNDDMTPSWVISSNADFNNKNKVVLYYNTDDSYSIQSIINEISGHIETNQGIYLRQQIGDALTGTIKEKGNTTTLVYQPKDVSVSLKQVYNEDNTKQIYKDLENEFPVDNSGNKYDVEIGTPIQEVVDNIISKHSADFKLNYDGYTTITSKDYKVFVNNLEVSTDVVPETDFEIRFAYDGFIAFDETPNIDFGQVKVSNNSLQTNSPVNADTKVKIINTTLTGKWALNVSLPEGIEGESGGQYLGEITYNDKDENKFILSKNSLMIEKQTANNLIQSIDMKGDSSKKGLLINQFVGNLKEKYSGKLLWSLEDAP